MATGPIQNSGSIGNLTSATEQAKKSGKTDKAEGGDSAAANPNKSNMSAADVAISDAARQKSVDRQKALDIARDTPDIREDRVASLKAQIDAGTYKIDSGRIADGMLREAIKEHLALND
jgi:negative regulator of flagellin synthesis FlgM